MTNAYLYRVARADEARVRGLVATLVLPPGITGWCFGGAAQWDFDPGKGCDNLRPLARLTDTASLTLNGDFGHAFSPLAEVRWKRIDQDHYDVLVLCETSQHIADATELAAKWRVADQMQQVVFESPGGAQKVQTKVYLAPNGAVQFLRYYEV